jgi:methylenetetrahydrofolate dehydrogenase (NADP+)/methenyltetrahydrofolate cyclohydrolase
MTAVLIDGNALSQRLRADFAERTQSLISQGIQPGLAVILVGDNLLRRYMCATK